jgi:glycosyltransferase involved in cell wall biosynthesis
MTAALARARLHGAWAAMAPVATYLAKTERLRDVDVVRGAVLCDVHYTSSSDYLSGIQRVVRETASRWHATQPVTFVGWDDHVALRPLRESQHERMFGESERASREWRVLVPWESTQIALELMDHRQSDRFMTLARHSRNRTGVLGYDSIPVTSASTVAEGTSGVFVRWLAAARQADRAALISDAAAQEFRGIMSMGAGRRDPGPGVAAVPLAVEAGTTTAEDLAEAAAGLVMEDLPMVLVVGSHEPRKNHLAILQAAELLWSEGVRFTLVFVGAGSWKANDYESTLDRLVMEGRPVQSLRALPDRLLWAAYRLAHCTIFPSLNEGFGLPVAESLAVGTPVITSGYGSMRDILAPNGDPVGGLLVDPRDDASLLEAMRTLLTDDATYQRLKLGAAHHVGRTWHEFAGELWSFLVDGDLPPG